MSNRLIHESSPYLLQHAHNPVDWYPYGEEAFEKAGMENKPMLFSIGYSSCHWCHVMEHESFENEEVARLMNEKFVCVKVDREERPDVDHYYMDTVQLLHGNGGWPLNCFALPDGRPFWGGTYFRPEPWKELLVNISKIFDSEYDNLVLQAEELSKGIAGQNRIHAGSVSDDYSGVDPDEIFAGLERNFDEVNGGFAGSPKFPMPSVLQFLLKYARLESNKPAMEQALLSLRKMAMGGICDQAGGGFARYSVDSNWKVPHFEKMLYDNAQLLDVYLDAYKITNDRFYKEAAEGILAFTGREMTSPEGLFYSALDADSEGEEGLFYTWTPEEFGEALGPYAELMAEYYGVGAEGVWEKGRSILLRSVEDGLFAQRHFLSAEELTSLVKFCRSQLLDVRAKRVWPGLDDKVLVSWNALMIRSLVNAGLALDNPGYLESAVKAATFLLENLSRPDGGLYHTWKNGKAGIPAFLDDYAFLGNALLSLYKATCNDYWLQQSLAIARFAFEHLRDPESGLFYFSEESRHNPVRKLETYDGVIPSSNSVFAELLNSLGTLTDQEDYCLTASQMIRTMHDRIIGNSYSYANWASLTLSIDKPAQVVAVVGPDAGRLLRQLGQHFLPGYLIIGSTTSSEQPYFRDRFVPGKTLIYICTGNTCLLPVEDVESALKLFGP